MKYFFIGIALLAVFSCKRKSTDPEPTAFVGTPYNLVYPNYFKGSLNIPSTNLMSVEGVKLGRMLFYEKKLSSDNTISCGSCHKQKFAFSDSVAFSSGVGGTLGTRNAMALSNLAFQSLFFWDGRANSLEQQVPSPIINPLEMHQVLDTVVKELQATTTYPPLFKAAFGSDVITANNIANAISQFERTFVSYRSRYDQYLQDNTNALTAQEQAGLILFMTHPLTLSDPGVETPLRGGNCGDCHQGTLLTIQTFLNNGLDSVFKDQGRYDVTGNPADMGAFKIPSLRNIALTAPYMHDGRFATLQDVLTHYNEHVTQSPTMSPKMFASNTYTSPPSTYLDLTPDEIASVLAFLYTLTDSSYISDTTLSNPFVNSKP